MVLRRMQRAWSWYQSQLVKQPVRTQIATSAMLWATGDAVAQRIDREMWQSRQRRESRTLHEGQCTPALAAEQVSPCHCMHQTYGLIPPPCQLSKARWRLWCCQDG